MHAQGKNAKWLLTRQFAQEDGLEWAWNYATFEEFVICPLWGQTRIKDGVLVTIWIASAWSRDETWPTNEKFAGTCLHPTDLNALVKLTL